MGEGLHLHYIFQSKRYKEKHKVNTLLTWAEMIPRVVQVTRLRQIIRVFPQPRGIVYLNSKLMFRTDSLLV